MDSYTSVDSISEYICKYGYIDTFIPSFYMMEGSEEPKERQLISIMLDEDTNSWQTWCPKEYKHHWMPVDYQR